MPTGLAKIDPTTLGVSTAVGTATMLASNVIAINTGWDRAMVTLMLSALISIVLAEMAEPNTRTQLAGYWLVAWISLCPLAMGSGTVARLTQDVVTPPSKAMAADEEEPPKMVATCSQWDEFAPGKYKCLTRGYDMPNEKCIPRYFQESQGVMYCIAGRVSKFQAEKKYEQNRLFGRY